MKKNKKGHKCPIVAISFLDHSLNDVGASEPISFTAVGVVLEETDLGYVLAHWIQNDTRLEDACDTSTFILKGVIQSIQTIGHLLVKA